MERAQYLAVVLREANAFVARHGDALHGALGGDGSPADCDGLIEEQLKPVLVSVDHCEDVVKHSGLREPDASFWREAASWQEALAGAAMASLAHDVRERARDIVEGRMPQMDNIQES